MLDQVKVVIKAMVEDDEFSDLMAELMWKNYKALIAKGFSEEQAMTLLASSAFKLGG